MGFSGCIFGTVEKLPPIFFKWQTFLFDYFVKLIILFLPIYISIPSSNHEFTARGNPGFTMVYHPKIWVFPCLFHGFPWVFHGFSMGFPMGFPGNPTRWWVPWWARCLMPSPTSSWASLTTFPCRASRRSIGSFNGPSGSRPRCNGATDHVGRAEVNQHAKWQCVGLGYIIIIVIGWYWIQTLVCNLIVFVRSVP